MPTERVLVEISGHGLGHLSQTAPVINGLRRLRPQMNVIVRTTIPRQALQGRIRGAFDLIPAKVDPGLVMNSAVHIDVDRSYEAYRRFHADWDRAMDAATDELGRISPNLVVTNVSYLVLAAAARAGVRRVAMSSINWGDMFAHYCGHRSGANAVVRQIWESYACADFFLGLTPGMLMPTMPRLRRIGAVAVRGRSSAACIRRQLGVPADRPLVLLALGGIPTTVDFGAWPPLDDIAVITDLQGDVQKPGYFDASRIDLPFVDLLASCDAVITKPGYGTFTEAARNGVRVLHTRRPDWPETPSLCKWLQQQATSAAIDWNDLMVGRFVQPLRRLLALPVRPPAVAAGVEAAAEILAAHLSP